MKYGISNLSIVPMRNDACDQSEMVNQILFGEHFKALESRKKWSKIRLAHDSYEGWICNKQWIELSEDDYKQLDKDVATITTDILDIITKQKKRLIQISTDEVFGSLATTTATEDSKFNPSSPYAATKAAAELLANSYSVTYNSDIIITRCSNNFGPRQFPEKLIPKTIILAEQNKKIPIYGNGKNIRDWIFVEDHCEAVLASLLKGKSGQSYNIAADNEIDNISIVTKILEIMNKSQDLIEFVEDRPGHDQRYSMNSAKISKELGWKTQTKFEDGLEKTISWYMENPQIWKNLDSNIFESTPWKVSN